MASARDLKDAGETSIIDKQTGQVYELDAESLSIVDASSGDPSAHKLKKGLNARHIQLIALGGCIGTGLFVGTSSTLHTCGPAGLFTAYLIISVVIYAVMNALGEMVCYLPGSGNDTGGSISKIVSRYVDPSLGFATGWNYYYTYVILVAAECTAASGVVTYWTTAVPSGVWIAIFLVVCTLLNFGPVKYYGESEFWFAIIKILCIVGLLIVSFILFWGGGPNHDRLGFRYWKHPGAFTYHITSGSTGQFLDIWTGVIKGGFAFILGPELVALTSAEALDSRRNIAKASKRFVYRLIFFYVTSSLAIGVIVAYNDKNLASALSQGKSGAASSPFVIGIQNAGIKGLPHIINACILTSAWSSGNSYLFAASRSLLSMAEDGTAPKVFAKINRFGVPYNAVGLSGLLSCLAFLNVSSGAANVFAWFSNISTISGFIGWICIGVAYLRFREAIFFRGLFDRVPFKTPFQPYSTYFFIVVVSVICLTNGYVSFIPKFWNAADFVAAYITLPIFVALWVGHKLCTRTWDCWAYPVAEIDVTTGLVEIEEETKELDAKRQPPTGKFEKFVEWLL
ncbi:LANO_0E08306g1_1 [Lachancea nothofagi CBS 11611]|uniref:LANO_0E08306g1_1 n=1 Tax=Lachancea nothofagi CBS 11611 TaxID=1266666 RepID=A0A1G4JV11_9SACH|nr:LANO_0E08306g1_1 [Lachancea nothofagi CBS 11611]